MTHIVGKLDNVLRRMADHRDNSTAAGDKQPTKLQQRIEQVRNSLSQQGCTHEDGKGEALASLEQNQVEVQVHLDQDIVSVASM